MIILYLLASSWPLRLPFAPYILDLHRWLHWLCEFTRLNVPVNNPLITHRSRSRIDDVDCPLPATL